MAYLFLAILSSSMIAFLFKFAENRQMNPYVITSANYFIAAMISLFLILKNQLLNDLVKGPSFFKEWSLLLSNEQTLLSPYNSVLWGLGIGLISGIFFFSSFLYYQISVKENGVSLSGTFSKLGILIPMIFSIFIWKEYPSPIQWLGILLSLVSILIVNLSRESLKSFNLNKTILLLFFLGGIAEFSNKIYQKYALNYYKEVFLLAVFLSAFLISFIYANKKGSKWKLKEILTGFAVGIPNLFSSYFLILSLDTIPTSVAFPIFSAASIVLINIGGFLIFKEKIATKDKWAIVLVILALILINI